MQRTCKILDLFARAMTGRRNHQWLRRRVTKAGPVEPLEYRLVLSSISVIGPQIVYSGSPGEINTLTVSESAGTLTFTDTGATITPGVGPFTVVNANEVTISAAGISVLSLNLGDMNDSLDASGIGTGSGLASLVINGQEGDDTIIGSQILDAVSVNGTNPGSDTIDLQGGTNDRLVLTVDLDITVTDSTFQLAAAVPGTYAGIEDLRLTGGASANVIDASAVTSASGLSFVLINGQQGNDTITGSQIRDIITVSGTSPGTDTIDGQGGTNDELNVTADLDITITDSTFQVGTATPGTYSGFDILRLTGGAADNVIDASAVTIASGLTSVVISGREGDDTIIGSEISDTVFINGANPGSDHVDGRGGIGDQLVVSLDSDITLTDNTLQIGTTAPGTWVAFENLQLQGGAGNNVIDAAALSSAISGISISMFGHGGDDTFRTGNLNHQYVIQGDSGASAGFDVLDLTASDISPNVNITGLGSIDGQKGNFLGGIAPSGFDNINEILLPPEYNFTAATYSAAEGDVSNMTFVVEVTRSVNTDIASSVNVVLTGGSATAGSDFTAGPVTVNFSAGEMTKSVPIEILGDGIVEADETISLSMADGISGTVIPSAALTILDDDVSNRPPTLTAAATDATFEDKAKTSDTVSLSATFTDPDEGDIHTAVIDWGDGTMTAGIVDSLAGTISGTHNYSTGGLFDVSVTVLDGAGTTDVIVASAVVSGIRLTVDGELQVIGTDFHDHVSVREGDESQAGMLLVSNHHHHDWWRHGWWDHGHGHQTVTFSLNDVTSILIHTCDGNDHVHINSNVYVSATVHAGAGHDQVSGGSGDD
ncbi:MAG: hypothetical protein KDA91_09420, partial [Planctomycetaceae bacterium]|nr:hypothetical protein [Planctomycetaceae bacterium]